MRVKVKTAPESKSVRGGEVTLPSVPAVKTGFGVRAIGSDAKSPFVLATGCDSVVLEATQLPERGNGQVTWSVDPQPIGPVPLVRISGNTTELKTDLVGPFTITARCDDEVAKWFVHFVSVKLLANSVKTTPSENVGPAVNCQKGRIAAFATWEFEAKVELDFGSGSGNPSPEIIQVGVIQNQIEADTHFFSARYVGHGQFDGSKLFLYEKANSAPPHIDADNDAFPFYTELETSGTVRDVSALDSPGGTFPAFVNKAGQQIDAVGSDDFYRLEAIKGECRFRTAIAARSTHAPKSCVIVHELCWNVQIGMILGLELKPSAALDLDLYNIDLAKESKPLGQSGTFDMTSPVSVKPSPPAAFGIEIAGPPATDLERVISSSTF